MSTQVSEQLVTIFGGSGFLGRNIVRVLAKKGYRIRVAVRRPELAGHLQPLGNVGQIQVVQSNINNEPSVNHAVKGSDVVINLVGILYQSRTQSFKDIHVYGAEHIARAAMRCGAHTFVHMSAIGADEKSRSRYARTKAQAEQVVLEEFPGAVILRPSVVFGPEDGLFNRFAELASISPALPLIGGGRTKMQPVYVGDVARALEKVIEGHGERGVIYELGGPQILTLKEIMQKTLEFSRQKRLLIWMPTILAKIMGLFMSMLPKPPLTLDQVRLLAYDNIVSDRMIAKNQTFAGLGITELRTVNSIVPSYLQRFRPKGQFSAHDR